MTLTGIENAFKTVGHDIVVAAKAIEGAAAKITGEAAVVEPIVNTILGSIDPAAAGVVEAGESLLAKALAAIAAIGPAAAAKGLTLSLDQAAVADITAIYNALKSKPAVSAAAPAAS